MADIFTKVKRSEVMSRIGAHDTKPEIAVRSILHRMGYRFRLHRTDLLGKPDLVLPRYRTVIFVNGCFWHQHKRCRFAYTPKSRQSFWVRKLESNIVRDRIVKAALTRLGWYVITVWECELRCLDRLSHRLNATLKRRYSGLVEKSVYS